MCRIPRFVALSDHNPPTLQTDGQTDVMLVAKAGHTCGMSRIEEEVSDSEQPMFRISKASVNTIKLKR